MDTFTATIHAFNLCFSVYSPKDHKGAITTLQFNWNDSVIASGSESGEILLYNVVSGVASSPLVGAKSQVNVLDDRSNAFGNIVIKKGKNTTY